jgi:CTP synthase (UTP-ammonia lyase)
MGKMISAYVGDEMAEFKKRSGLTWRQMIHKGMVATERDGKELKQTIKMMEHNINQMQNRIRRQNETLIKAGIE